jgi:hypothetical protein
MTKEEQKQPQHQPHRVRLPGFLIEQEIGLGDAIKRVTYAMGMKPCSGCEKSAVALNLTVGWCSLVRRANPSPVPVRRDTLSPKGARVLNSEFTLPSSRAVGKRAKGQGGSNNANSNTSP